jgi:hypothetical protein
VCHDACLHAQCAAPFLRQLLLLLRCMHAAAAVFPAVAW